MANDKVTSKIERSELWTTAIVVTLFMLLVEFVVIATFWDQLCAKIAITALEYGAEQLVSEKVFDGSYDDDWIKADIERMKAERKIRQARQLEEFKADLERMAPSETVDEALERMDRMIRKTDTWPFYEYVDDE